MAIASIWMKNAVVAGLIFTSERPMGRRMPSSLTPGYLHSNVALKPVL